MRLHIRRNDVVKVLAGKDCGKSGKVIEVFKEDNRAAVQGIQFVKKHRRRRSQEDPGGIVQQERPVHVSNLMLVCPRCKKGVRIGIKILQDGSRVRVCKKCRELID